MLQVAITLLVIALVVSGTIFFLIMRKDTNREIEAMEKSNKRKRNK